MHLAHAGQYIGQLLVVHKPEAGAKEMDLLQVLQVLQVLQEGGAIMVGQQEGGDAAACGSTRRPAPRRPRT